MRGIELNVDMGSLNCCETYERISPPYSSRPSPFSRRSSPYSPPPPTARPRNRYESVAETKGAPTGKKWYHGGIPDEEAEERLRSVAEGNGNFLVYNTPYQKDEYVLLVFFDGLCHRWIISRRSDGTYIVGKDGPGVKSYPTVRALIKKHRGLKSKPLPLQHGGAVKLTDYAFVSKNAGNSKWRGN